MDLEWLRQAWQQRHATPLVCRAAAEELLRVLSYPKFQLAPSERDELLADILPFCEAVAPLDPPPRVPACREPLDRIFLRLALAGDADAVVTGDGDLLALASDFPIPILSPAAFRGRFTEAHAGEMRKPS